MIEKYKIDRFCNKPHYKFNKDYAFEDVEKQKIIVTGELLKQFSKYKWIQNLFPPEERSK